MFEKGSLLYFHNDFEDFNSTSHNGLTLPRWTCCKLIKRICRKTGLEKSDGSERFADAGFFMTLEVMEGKFDGLVFETLECSPQWMPRKYLCLGSYLEGIE